jgi:hypothetical protein
MVMDASSRRLIGRLPDNIGVFQELFDELPRASRHLHCGALLLITLTLGLLVTPWMRHRVVDSGQDTNNSLRADTLFAGAALVPLALALCLDVVILERLYGFRIGLALASALLLLTLSAWYVMEFVLRREGLMKKKEVEKRTPLSTKVDQLLTEARVIIPGAQALLGFQFTVTLTRSFEELPAGAKLAHIVALFCVATAMILLMTPAALHCLSFGGEDAPEVLKIGSAFVIAAPVPLALGIAIDTYVASRRALNSDQAAVWLAGLALTTLFGLWYASPVLRRWSSA